MELTTLSGHLNIRALQTGECVEELVVPTSSILSQKRSTMASGRIKELVQLMWNDTIHLPDPLLAWVLSRIPRCDLEVVGMFSAILTIACSFLWLIFITYRSKLDRWPCHVTLTQKKAIFSAVTPFSKKKMGQQVDPIRNVTYVTNGVLGHKVDPIRNVTHVTNGVLGQQVDPIRNVILSQTAFLLFLM